MPERYSAYSGLQLISTLGQATQHYNLNYKKHMSMSWDIMKAIAQGSGNLIIEDTASCNWDLLRELAQIAKRSGAHITVSEAHISWDIARELVAIAGGQITIKCGLSKIKA